MLMGKLQNKPTQCDRIIDYIHRHGSITMLDAYLDIGVSQLGARIFELKHKYGYVFGTRWIDVKNRYGEKCKVKEYFLVESEVKE